MGRLPPFLKKNMTFKTNMTYYVHFSPLYTLDDSHRTVTSEVVQAIKSVKENIEDCI